MFARSSLVHDIASHRNKGTGYIKDMPFIVHILHVLKKSITYTKQKCYFALPASQTAQKKTGASMWVHALGVKVKEAIQSGNPQL